MLKNYTMSRHLIEDREERLVKIAMTIGFGEVIKESTHNGATIFLTNTGIIYVVNKQLKIIITVYVATINEISAIYNGKIPSCIFNKVKKNERRFRG